MYGCERFVWFICADVICSVMCIVRECSILRPFLPIISLTWIHFHFCSHCARGNCDISYALYTVNIHRTCWELAYQLVHFSFTLLPPFQLGASQQKVLDVCESHENYTTKCKPMSTRLTSVCERFCRRDSEVLLLWDNSKQSDCYPMRLH